MSEEKKEVLKEEQRIPFTIDVEPGEFEPEFAGKYLTSKEFCSLTNEIFRAVFDDYVGSQFEISNGTPLMSLYFDHARKSNDGTYACEQASSKSTGNVTMDKIRRRDIRIKEGDRYHLTEDGQDVIKTLLHPRFFNQGKIQWKNIVSDIQERTVASYYQPQNIQQMTKVIGVDPVAICKLIWGTETDADGKGIDYGIEVRGSLTQGMPNNIYPNYLLTITRAYSEQIHKTYEKLGYGGIVSSIIR